MFEIREDLKPLVGQRLRLSATVSRFGWIAGIEVTSILLTYLKHGDRVLAKHCWVKLSKRMIGIERGQRVEFNATVTPYLKEAPGLPGVLIRDYRIRRLRAVEVVPIEIPAKEASK